MKQRKTRRLRCPICPHVGTRLFRLKSHATSKHRIRQNSAKMGKFVSKCRAINSSGERCTTIANVKDILGRFSGSPSHMKVAKKVLHYNNVQVEEKAVSPVKEIAVDKKCTKLHARSPKSAIEASGLVADFTKLCCVAESYRRLCTSARPATVHANAKFVHRFLEWARSELKSQGSDLSIILDPSLPFEFQQTLSSVFKPYTVKNHLSGISSFLDTVLCNRDFRIALGVKPHQRELIRTAREAWNCAKSKTQKIARARQRKATRSGEFKNAPIVAILKYLMKYEVLCAKYLNESFAENTEMNHIVQCVCGIYMALHGQRLCAILNLTQIEVNTAHCIQGRYILRISRHKQADTSGPACIALRRHQYCILKGMSDSIGRDGRAFPLKYSGHVSGELFKPLNAFIYAESKERRFITCNLIRKTYETNKFLASTTASIVNERVSSYLCHGKSATDLHYIYKTDQQVVNEAFAVESVLSSVTAFELFRSGCVKLPRATEPFPAVEHLVDSLRKAFPSKDVSFQIQQRTPLYDTVLEFWREDRREELLQDLRKQFSSHELKNNNLFVAKTKTLLSSLDSVWRQDDSIIAAALQEDLFKDHE